MTRCEMKQELIGVLQPPAFPEDFYLWFWDMIAEYFTHE